MFVWHRDKYLELTGILVNAVAYKAFYMLEEKSYM